MIEKKYKKRLKELEKELKDVGEDTLLIKKISNLKYGLRWLELSKKGKITKKQLKEFEERMEWREKEIEEDEKRDKERLKELEKELKGIKRKDGKRRDEILEELRKLRPSKSGYIIKGFYNDIIMDTFTTGYKDESDLIYRKLRKEYGINDENQIQKTREGIKIEVYSISK